MKLNALKQILLLDCIKSLPSKDIDTNSRMHTIIISSPIFRTENLVQIVIFTLERQKQLLRKFKKMYYMPLLKSKSSSFEIG